MIHRKITWPYVLISSIIFILFLMVVLPSEARRSSEYFGDAGTPDTSFYYDADALYDMAQEMGDHGRRYYIQSRLSFDVVWPLAYGFFLWTGIGFFGSFLRLSFLKYLMWLPLLSVIFDYLENMGASLIFYLYPTRLVLLPMVVPWFTFFKWFWISGSFILLFVLFLMCLYKKIRNKMEV